MIYQGEKRCISKERFGCGDLIALGVDSLLVVGHSLPSHLFPILPCLACDVCSGTEELF